MQSHGKLIASYPKLFNERSKEDDERIEGEATVQKKKQETFHEYWGYYGVVDALSNNDVTKWEQITKMNVIEFLNVLAYYKDKQKYQHQLIHGTGTINNAR